jgi:hypothetical protein
MTASADKFPPEKFKTSWLCGNCCVEIDWPFEQRFCGNCGEGIDWDEVSSPPEPDYDWKRDR